MLTLAVTRTATGVLVSDGGSVPAALAAAGMDPSSVRVQLRLLTLEYETYPVEVDLTTATEVVVPLTLDDNAYYLTWLLTDVVGVPFSVEEFPDVESATVFYAEDRKFRLELQTAQVAFFTGTSTTNYRALQRRLDRALTALDQNNPTHFTRLITTRSSHYA